MIDKLTQKSQETLSSAQFNASEAGHPEITPLHILNALLNDVDGIVPMLIKKQKMPLPFIQSTVQEQLNKLPTVQGSTPQSSPSLNTLLQHAKKEADKLGDQYISAEHLLLALEKSTSVSKNG